MSRKLLALLGLVIFLLGLGLLLRLWQGITSAQDRDRQVISTRPIDVNCRDIFRTVNVASRVMTERDSQALMVVLATAADAGPCDTAVILVAPNFSVTPPELVRDVQVPAGGELLTLVWILSPHRTGFFEIAITAGNQVWTVGITVTTVLGLTAAQAQLLAYLAAFLGPMLTAPWWYDRWQERRVTAQTGK